MFLLDCQINYVEYSSIMNSAVKNFDILATSLNMLRNYFDDLNKIIFRSVFIIAKFLRTSVKSFFPCRIPLTKSIMCDTHPHTPI